MNDDQPVTNPSQTSDPWSSLNTAENPLNPNAAVETIPAMQPTKKKPVRPVFLGLLMGAVIVAAASLLLLDKPPAQVDETALVQTPTVEPIYLDVFTNENATAVNGEVLVSGKTLPNSVVMAYSESDTTSTVADEAGLFESTVVLADGGGLVEIAVFSEDGQEISRTFQFNTVVLGTKDEAPGQTKKSGAKTDAKPTSSKDVVETTKAEKSTGAEMKAEEKPVKTETKNTGAVKKPVDQTAMSEAAKAKTTKLVEPEAEKVKAFLEEKAPKEKKEKLGVKLLKDLRDAEGSASAELQKRKELKVQEMKVMAATAGAELKRHAVAGVITALSADSITITHQIQTEREYVVFYNGATTFASKGSEASGSGQLAVGQRIAAVGEPIEGGLLAKRVHVIPGKAVGVMQKQPDRSDDDASESGAVLSPTPSASVSASPSPNSTPSASPTPLPIEPSEQPDPSPSPDQS